MPFLKTGEGKNLMLSAIIKCSTSFLGSVIDCILKSALRHQTFENLFSSNCILFHRVLIRVWIACVLSVVLGFRLRLNLLLYFILLYRSHAGIFHYVCLCEALCYTPVCFASNINEQTETLWDSMETPVPHSIVQTYCFDWPHEKWITIIDYKPQMYEWSLTLYRISCFLPAKYLISSCSSISPLNVPSGEHQTVVSPHLPRPSSPLWWEWWIMFQSLQTGRGGWTGVVGWKGGRSCVRTCVGRRGAAGRRSHAGMALCCRR